MSLPSSESADDPAVNSINHTHSKKEAFLINIFGRPGTLGLLDISLLRPTGTLWEGRYKATLIDTERIPALGNNDDECRNTYPQLYN